MFSFKNEASIRHSSKTVCCVAFTFPGLSGPHKQAAGGCGSKVGGLVTMRQAVEAQVLNTHCELGEHGQYIWDI